MALRVPSSLRLQSCPELPMELDHTPSCICAQAQREGLATAPNSAYSLMPGKGHAKPGQPGDHGVPAAETRSWHTFYLGVSTRAKPLPAP